MNRFFAGIVFGMVLAASAAMGLTLTGTNSEYSASVFQVGTLALTREGGLTAAAGGGATNATQLSAGFNRITVVATAGDSVKLPACRTSVSAPLQSARMIVVANADSADAMDVFPATGEFINALSVNTALSITANKVVVFFCAVDGTWQSLLTA